MSNSFLRDPDFYQRSINPIRDYIHQASYFLSKKKGVGEEQVRSKLIEKFKLGEIPGYHDPIVRFYERENYADRHVTESKLSTYIGSLVQNEYVLTPSFTCYVSTKEKQSILVEFADGNTKNRAIAKKEAKAAKSAGNITMWMTMEGRQANLKLYNNSLSGAFSSFGNILRNPTSHSSLTSTTRTMTSIGNASNEKMIAGNRHYRNPEITLYNIISLAMAARKTDIVNVMMKFGIRVPTVDETMACIYHSSRKYWDDPMEFAYIRSFVETLTDAERSGVVYMNDLYHLRVFNEEVIRNWLTRLGTKIVGVKVDEPLKVIRETEELVLNFVHQTCMSECRGMGMRHNEMDEVSLHTVAATSLNVQRIVDEWRDFIQCFFLTEVLPCSVAYIRSILRETVVLSDTDSTMFSCDEWVEWYFGEVKFDDESYGISSSVMFLATQSIAHNLALYSANLGVERKKLFMAGMKPEYFFPVLALTSAAKHYYTYAMVKEGNVYDKLEFDKKGVHLKSSAQSPVITEDADQRMRNILDTVMAGKKISLGTHISETASIEKDIINSVRNGEIKYFKRDSMKKSDAYTAAEEDSPYQHYLNWNRYWAESYSVEPPPPYDMVKIPIRLPNKTAIRAWLENMQDKALAERLTRFVTENNKSEINTFYISTRAIDTHGIPKEIHAIVDVDKMILDITVSHRMILGSLDYFPKTGRTLSSQGY